MFGPIDEFDHLDIVIISHLQDVLGLGVVHIAVQLTLKVRLQLIE